MAERAQDAAPLRPAQLLRHAAGTAADHHDPRAGREIERAAVLVHRKPIGYKLHGRRRCKNVAHADHAANRGIAVRTRQIFQIE
jgi:hypothetical protein